MGKGRFVVGQKLQLKGEYFQISGIVEDKYRIKSLHYKDQQLLIKEEDLLDAYDNGDLTFPESGKNTNSSEGVAEYDFPGISLLPEKQQKEVRFRWSVIKSLVDIEKGLSKAVERRLEELKAAGKDLLGRDPPSRATVYRWIKSFHESQRDWRSLRTDYEKPHRTQFDDEIEQEIVDIIERLEGKGEDVTVETLHEHLLVRITAINKERKLEGKLAFDIPSESTLRRRIIGMNPYERDKKRYGEEVAYGNHGYVQTGVKTTRPLERWEIDHTQIDLIVVDDTTREILGRPFLTSIIDAHTRCIVGFHVSFDPPSFVSVLFALKNAIQRKTYVPKMYPAIKKAWTMFGVPETLVCDNGKDFTSIHLEDVCNIVGINLDFCKPGTPRMKGKIERHFRSLNQGLLHQLPGTTFSNVKERKSKKYDSEAKAAIGFEKLKEMIHTWVIEIYNMKSHRGVRRVPADVWDKQIKLIPPALPTSPKWMELVGKVKEGSIHGNGIRYLYLDYNSRELGELRKDLLMNSLPLKVNFRYDPENMGVIRVFDPIREKHIEVPCTDQDYANGLSEYMHNVLIRSMNEKDRENRLGRAEAKVRVFNDVQEELKKTKRGRRALQQMKKDLNEAKRGDRQTSVGVSPTTEPKQDKSKDLTVAVATKVPYELKNITEKDWGRARVRKIW